MASSRDPFWISTGVESTAKHEHYLYRLCRPLAKWAKILLQFFVGLGLIALLAIKAVLSLFPSIIGPLWLRADQLRGVRTLELVALALEYSAGVELAYTLFTEGPDEAVEPVIMALAAAMLLAFSKLDSIDLPTGFGAIAFVIALAGIFLIRHYFVEPDSNGDPENETAPGYRGQAGPDLNP